MDIVQALVMLLPIVPFAAVFAVRYRWWWLMAIAALLVLPVALVSHAPFGLFWLVAFVLLAAAVALRWRLRIAGWFGLVLSAVAVWTMVLAGYAFGPSDLPLYWILFAAALAGCLALGWDRPPWQAPAQFVNAPKVR